MVNNSWQVAQYLPPATRNLQQTSGGKPMELSGEYTFDAPQEMVWEALQDPEVLASIMPGGEGFEAVGDNEYTGTLNIRVGPVQGKFNGHIQLSNLVAPESYDISVDGKGAPGFVKASGGLKLSGQGEQTHMAYSGKAQIGGRIATVGQRLLDASAKSIVRQSLEGLNEYLRSQVAAQTVTAAEVEGGANLAEETAVPQSPPPTYQPPSQTKVAMNVAKDVAGDLIPAHYRPILIGLLVVIVVVILYLIFT
jgi:uncharacterized protein